MRSFRFRALPPLGVISGCRYAWPSQQRRRWSYCSRHLSELESYTLTIPGVRVIEVSTFFQILRQEIESSDPRTRRKGSAVPPSGVHPQYFHHVPTFLESKRQKPVGCTSGERRSHLLTLWKATSNSTSSRHRGSCVPPDPLHGGSRISRTRPRIVK